METYGEKDGEPVFKIKFNKKIPVSDIVHNASIALGEAYMDHDLEIEGSIQDLIYDVYNHAEGFLRNSKFKKWMPKPEKHTKDQSREDIHQHYDLGNDFYELWLDPSLTYSCAYFKKPDDSLAQAQINKVHHILEKLFIKEGESLLDIGCGWGTLIFIAAKEYGVKATGITLSQEQYDHIQHKIKDEGLEEQVSVQLLDYRDIKGQYDHITSVGMFEHVDSENLSQYFADIKAALKPAGTALIHGISRQQGGARNAWINKYIFPGGYIPGVTELVDNITANDLQLIDLESLRHHYQRTLECWTENFHQAKEAVLQQKDDTFYRMWDLYLQACAASFQSSNIDVIQYLLVNPNNNSIPIHRNV